MADYIDREKVRELLFEYYACVKDKKQYNHTLFGYEVADMIEDCLENSKTEDVVPRAELEALVADMRQFARQWFEEKNGFPCRFCKFEDGAVCKSEQRNKTHDACVGQFFEWRGLPAGKETCKEEE